MNRALCQSNGTLYAAADFSRLAPDSLAVYRRELVCPGCGARAFFRHRARDGRAECFGSHDHSPDCTHTTTRTAASAEPTDQGLSDVTTIRIHVGPDQTDANDDRKTQLRTRHAPVQGQSSISQRTLRTLLRHLINEAAFPYSDTVIDAPGIPPLPAWSFFVRFENINDHYLDEDRGYWGTVVSYGWSAVPKPSSRATDSSHPDAPIDTAAAKRSSAGKPPPGAVVAGPPSSEFGAVKAGTQNQGKTLWLNTGSPREPSVLIGANEAAAVLRAQHVTEPEELVGSYLLVVGRCRRSRTGKLYIKPATPSAVSFRRV